MLYETGSDGQTRITGLRVGPQGREKTITADAYVAALDVPGIKKFLPQVRASGSCSKPSTRITDMLSTAKSLSPPSYH